MKKIFITSLMLITLLSCDKPTQKVEPVKELPSNVTVADGVKVIRLTDHMDHGLSHVIVNDTLEVLIYRGVESVSMVRIK